MKKALLALGMGASTLYAAAPDGDFCFPKNNLNLEDRIDRKDANIDEATFNKIITKVGDYYSPIVAAHGATLVFKRNWTDSTVNAYANQQGSTWNVAMFGGLARRPETTPDGFAMVVCHELGHHLGGFPYYDEGWAASEGQADYFATQACAKNIWKNDLEENARYRDIVPAVVKTKCNAAYSEEAEQNICYRTADAGRSLATLLAALRQSSVPQYDTPDPKTVSRTVASHPAAQCRLDTYFNGALCNAAFEEDVIPGRHETAGQSSVEAEKEAAIRSCTVASFYSLGKRPRCWYAPKMSLKIKKDAITKTEIIGNGNDTWEPGETFGINIPLENALLAPIENAKLTVTEVETGAKFAGSTSNYPTINPGDSAYASKPVAIGTPRSRTCGDRVTLNAKVEVKNWSEETTLNFVMGAFKTIETKTYSTVTPIPDGDKSGVNTEFVATTDKETKRVELDLNISHPYRGDLKVSLISPAGKTYLVFDRKGSGADDLKGTFGVDIAPEKIKGTWKVNVADISSRDSGKINSIGINFKTLVCEPALSLVSKN